MPLGIGFGAERVALVALRWPRTAMAVVLGFLLLVGLSLPKLQFDDDIHRAFLSDSALSMAQRRFDAAEDPPTTTILALLQGDAAFTPDDLNALREVSLDLELADGIRGVVSPFVLRLSPQDGAENGVPLFPAQIGTDIWERLEGFRALDTGLPTFIGAERTDMLIAISVDLDQTSVGAALEEISATFDSALPDGVRLTLTGEDVISLEIVQGLKGDLVALNLWGGLLVAFAAWVLLRDVRMVVLAVVPALCAAASVLALSVWLGLPITVLSNVIPILLLVLGVADGVHLAGDLKSTGACADRTVRRIGPACALTALTTAAAFASVMVTGNAQLFEFALLGALGTLLAFVLTITMFALLARVIVPSATPVPHAATAVAGWFAQAGMRRPGLVIAAAVVVLAVSVAGYLRTKPWFPLYQNLPQGSATVAANDAITAHFGGAFSMIVEVGEDWEQLQTLTEKLRTIAGPEAVLSQANIAAWLGTPDTPPSAAQLESFPETLRTRLGPAPDTRRIFVSVPEPMRDADSLAKFDELYAAAYAGGARDVLGLPTVMRIEAVDLIRQLSWGLVLASVSATLLVAGAFRSVRLIPVLLVPNLLPLMLTGASLHLWAGGQLSPTAVLALTIAFGIAIDDTVHFLGRFAEARRKGATPGHAIMLAARSAGEVMVLTTLLLTVGLCITLTSDFFPIRLFGGMMIVTLWAALVLDLLLLPALLSKKDPLDDQT